jgi:pilus assembly protein CpaB
MRFIVLGIIVLFALAAGYASLQLAGQSQPAPTAGAAPQPISAVNVLVAKQPIPLGTVISEEMVDQQPWPQHLVLDGFITADNKDTNLIGMVTRSDFQEREPLILSKLGNPNDGNFLAASIGKGMRAVTLSVDAISGVAGYLFPGDRVDILVTHATGDNSGSPNASEILIANVKVLATDLRKAGNKTSGEAPSNLTLEVTTDDAQKIKLAEKRGTLSIALRSLKDKDETGVASPTTLKNLSRLQGGQISHNGVLIVRGTVPTTQTSTTTSDTTISDTTGSAP